MKSALRILALVVGTFVVGTLFFGALLMLFVGHPGWGFSILVLVVVVTLAVLSARHQAGEERSDLLGQSGKTRLVRRYKGERDLERGLNDMAKHGWVPEGTSTRKQAYSVLTGVFTSGQIHTVTYVRAGSLDRQRQA